MSKLKSKWMENPSSYNFIEEVPTGTVNGVNVTFTLSSVPLDMVSLTLNGRPLKPTIDYTRSGSTITMIVAPALGQELYAIYY
jgi:hypothetical protein